MPRTKQSQMQQSKWTDIFADDSDNDDDAAVAALGPPATKKPRLLDDDDDDVENLSVQAASSTTHSSVVARINTSHFASFLSSSSSSDNEKPQILTPPLTTRKRRPSTMTQQQQQPPQGSSSGSPRRWRLQPMESANKRRKSTTTTATLSSEKKKKKPSTPLQPPEGWKTREQMYKIAKRHQGTFLQYRVLHRPPGGEQIRDHNFYCSKKKNSTNWADNDDDDDEGQSPPRTIFPQDLMVQSRFVSKTGNVGGNSYSFLDWKLPGNFLKKRNKQHMTIFKDTRPKLYSSSPKAPESTQQQNDTAPPQQQEQIEGTARAMQQQEPLVPQPQLDSPEPDDETAHPLLFLAPELAPDEVEMIANFVREAPAGCTPREFFRDRQDQLRLATPARELRRQSGDDGESDSFINVPERGERATSRRENGWTSTKLTGDTMEMDDTMLMASDDDDDDDILGPDATTVENGRFLQYVFHDVSPPRELERTAASPTESQPMLTEAALVAHQRRWSSSPEAPNHQIKRMLNWSNESNVNSDSEPPSRIENRFQSHSVIEQPHAARPVHPAVVAAAAKPASMPRTTSDKGVVNSAKMALLPNRPTWEDFSILGSASKIGARKRPPPSQFVVPHDRIQLPRATRAFPAKSPVQRNLERVFAQADGIAAGAMGSTREDTSFEQVPPTHDDDQRAAMDGDTLDDDPIPFDDDWNVDSLPISVSSVFPTTAVAAPKVAHHKTRVKSFKSGRNAMGSNFWFGILILCLLPVTLKFDPERFFVKECFQELSTLSKTWYSSISTLRMEDFIISSQKWADSIRSLRLEDRTIDKAWNGSLSLFRLEYLVSDGLWNSTSSFLEELLGGTDLESQEDLSGFPTPLDACSAAIHETKPKTSIFLPHEDETLVSESSVSAASSAQLETWLNGLHIGGFVTLGFAWFLLSFSH